MKTAASDARPDWAPLITPEALRELRRREPGLVILDVRFDLADVEAGCRAWDAGHVPGSQHVDLERDLSGAKTGRNGRHPLPERADFARTAGRLGITPATPVVVLDAQGGSFAARAWWLLRWLGHERVALLDGGIEGWQRAGGELVQGATVATPAPPYPAGKVTMPQIDADRLQQRLGRVRLIDARAAPRFRGDDEPLDAVAGHIPGALNRCWQDNLQAGRFKHIAQLQREFEDVLAGQVAHEVVHQCGSGVTACHNLFAMELAGLKGSVLYPGSWSEWSSDPHRPVARGPGLPG
jgi:thiosulfate/3-mercaptopyruvate sulfurtransferase